MPFGIAQITLQLPWETLIAEAGPLGFDGVQLFVSDDEQLARICDVEVQDSLRRTAHDAGVSINSLCATVLAHTGAIDAADEAVAAAAWERLERVARALQSLGGEVLLAPGAPDMEDEASVDRFAEVYRRAGDLAEQCGIILGVENGLPAAQQNAVLDAIDHDHVKDYFDIGNIAARGFDPAEEIRQRSAHIAQVHVKGIGGAALDAGTVDLAACASALAHIGYGGWLMLETRATEAAVAEAARNLEIMRSLVSG